MKIFFLIILCLLNNFINSNLNNGDLNNIRSIEEKKEKKEKRNLILGAIKRYSWEKIEAFFVSLYKANYFETCVCVIFVLQISQDTIDKLKSFGVLVFEFPEKYKQMKINNVRYKLYLEYLSDKIDKYDMVFHADIRDTIFQKDIFKIYENNHRFIGLSLENANINERINADWMKRQYGKEIYEELKDKQVINSGVIWGTNKEFYELVKNIWNEIEAK